MGKTYGAGISLAQTIGFKGNAPLLDDDVVANIDDLENCRKYYGHIVYVTDEDCFYYYSKASNAWKQNPLGSGTAGSNIIAMSSTDYNSLSVINPSLFYAIYEDQEEEEEEEEEESNSSISNNILTIAKATISSNTVTLSGTVENNTLILKGTEESDTKTSISDNTMVTAFTISGNTATIKGTYANNILTI